jgi:hypothetical protein
MRIINRATVMFVGLAAAATVACSNVTDPVQVDHLQGRWEGVGTTGVAYVYVFEAMGKDSTNPRTGNLARAYSLDYSTTPGSTGSVTAWYEGSEVYWGGTSMGTIVNAAMTVQAENVMPFIMHKR